jgi:hypothetical protein
MSKEGPRRKGRIPFGPNTKAFLVGRPEEICFDKADKFTKIW